MKTRESTSRRRTKATPSRLLTYAAVGYAVGMVVHGLDHAMRGFTTDDHHAAWPGWLQIVMAVLTLVVSALALALVISGQRYAPVAAIIIGFGSFAVFLTIHVLPRWGILSDSFMTAESGAMVTTYSWATAVLEMATALAFGIAGVRALKQGGDHRPRVAGTRKSVVTTRDRA